MLKFDLLPLPILVNQQFALQQTEILSFAVFDVLMLLRKIHPFEGRLWLITF